MKESDPSTPDFMDWLLPTLTTSVEATGIRPDPMVWDLAVGSSATADYYTLCWAYGKHFRVASRDVKKKTTFDCGISQMFVIDGEHKEYVGYVDAIVRLDFNTFETVLIKAQWYDSVHGNGRNATLVEDESGHLRVKEVNFASDNSPLDEPFAFPKDVEQLYFVKDKLHKGWLLGIKGNARSTRISYRKSCHSNGEFSGVHENAIDDACIVECSSSPRRGVRVSTEADDSAGEDIDIEEEESKMDSESSDEELSEEDGGEPFQHLRRGLIDGALALHANELRELASNGELEDFVEGRGKRRLNSW
jgi:hypothetical protein